MMKHVFFDVETTGLYSDDRIVSLGMLSVEEQTMRKGNGPLDMLHLVFDPGKRSHPRAEQVHGYDDWFLRHQSPFSDYADDIHRLFCEAERIVAHNAAFDAAFINREFVLLGLEEIPAAKFWCTMHGYRQKYLGSAGLDAILARLGMAQRGETHTALADAYYASCVYSALQGAVSLGSHQMFFERPTNERIAPPHPGLPLPRRSSKQREQAASWRKSYDDYDQVLRDATPIATILMYAAHLDGNASEYELATVSDYVTETAAKICVPAIPGMIQDVAAKLFELMPDEDALMDAVVAVADVPDGERVAMQWLERLILADGEIHNEEKFARTSIKMAFEIVTSMK